MRQTFVNRNERLVLVALMSPHLHLELVEVRAPVAHASADAPAFADLETINRRALARLREEKGHTVGPWADPVDSFAIQYALVATNLNTSIDRGRIRVLQQVPRKAELDWAAAAAPQTA